MVACFDTTTCSLVIVYLFVDHQYYIESTTAGKWSCFESV